MYSDEASISVVAPLSHTYAPKGCTPVITTSTEINLRLYLASTISETGQLQYMVRRQPFDSDAIIEYLEQLQGVFQKKLLIVWDGASIHDSEKLRAYLDTLPKGVLHLVQQPHYSPELNADEQVWNHLKNHKLKNTCNPTIKELSEKVTQAMEHLEKQPELISNFFKHPDLGYYN